MTVRNYAMGSLDPIIYFENNRGDISLPPSTQDALRIKDEMRHRGFELREAGTLPEVDALQKRLQQQEYDEGQKDLEHDERTFGAARKRVRERLYSRMVSGSTSPYERDFIKQYLMLADEKRSKWRNRFTADVSYLNIREYDSKHHLHELVDQMPEMKDTACKRCGRYRRAYGTEYCVGCLPVVGAESRT